MPTTGNFGIYIAEGNAGDEVSSTYEGRHVTVTAAELLTSAGGGVATKGLPCVFGRTGLNGVGVCFGTGLTTDLIAIDTEGIWDLLVSADHDEGESAVTGGDPLYINKTDGKISKRRNAPNQIPFGYALGIIGAGEDVVIPVKVHWDPQQNWLDNEQKIIFGEDQSVSMRWHQHEPGDGDGVNAGRGIYIEWADGYTCPGTGDYFMINAQGSPVLITGAGVCGLGVHVNPVGTDGQMAVAVSGQLNQGVTNAITGFLSAGRFIFKNASETCATAEALYLVIRNTAATGYGGTAHAFIRIHDESAGDRDCQNLFNFYLNDATKGAAADELICQSGSATSSSHVIKIVANGVPYWILMDATPPA